MSHTVKMNIQDLPDHILEKILLNYPTYWRKNLKLVCKKFKTIIEESPKIMENYVLDTSKCIKENCVLTARYQHLKFTRLGTEEFKFIYNYQHKERIKSIKLWIKAGEIEKYPMTVQYILLCFDNLVELIIYIKSDKKSNNSYHNVIKFAENSNSKLTYLRIDSYGDMSHVVGMFSDIKSIKKFGTCNQFKNFPDLKWELEELKLEYFDEDEEEDESVKAFLNKLKPCLKVLKTNNWCSVNYVVRKFPNLEKLHLNGGHEKKFSKELLPNYTLKQLKIDGLHCNTTYIENLLLHYRNIEVLKIPYECIDGDLSKKIELLNLKKLHLGYREEWEIYMNVDTYLSNLEVPNLKYLDIIKAPYNIPNIQKFMHVEYLKIGIIFLPFWNELDYFFEFLLKFPALKTLNIGNEDDYCFDAETITTVLKNVPTLKHLILHEYNYSWCDKKREIFFDKIKALCDEKNVQLSYSEY